MKKLPLTKDRVDLFLIQPQSVSDTLLTRFKQLISHQESMVIERKPTATAQRDALITRGFIRYILSVYAPIAPKDWIFTQGRHGKPFINNQPEGIHSDIQFNISHATGLIACAITHSQPIGLDVENTRRNSNTFKLAPRYFCPQEVSAIRALPPSQQVTGFYDYWTLKESYIKACGEGLAIPLTHFSFDLSCRNHIKIRFHHGRNDQPKQWQCKLFDVTNQHKMALTLNTLASQISTNVFEMNAQGELIEVQLPLINAC